jgi:hypothetical protein
VVLARLDRGYADVREHLNHEVRRIPLPRTPVNKGKKKRKPLRQISVSARSCLNAHARSCSTSSKKYTSG